ncbi:MAG TPA: type II toxin-antitoxin system RelE/ParE family toxin [Trinickia sp.]|jgi:toxin ParE1/3/4|uniref:type II toxin-antitoxin system RelE/ParE family toxin n=1 Tax=Trinickia sp. TaxID=2571163 RepID=UPI002CBE35F4|nr:type II toxin-antitoxin system RelE/ParE family toxin [Trinickia sp.]HVW51433.1 type II toxin-antitoxin system RelE/ParE family toxin [Trinickia sp.]
MLPIEWRVGARHDLVEIIGFIARENPAAARRLRELIDAATIPLAEHPYLFRRSDRVPGTREVVVHPNYVMVYQVSSTKVEIVAVVHTRQAFPETR